MFSINKYLGSQSVAFSNKKLEERAQKIYNEANEKLATLKNRISEYRTEKTNQKLTQKAKEEKEKLIQIVEDNPQYHASVQKDVIKALGVGIGEFIELYETDEEFKVNSEALYTEIMNERIKSHSSGSSKPVSIESTPAKVVSKPKARATAGDAVTSLKNIVAALPDPKEDKEKAWAIVTDPKQPLGKRKSLYCLLTGKNATEAKYISETDLNFSGYQKVIGDGKQMPGNKSTPAAQPSPKLSQKYLTDADRDLAEYQKKLKRK